MVTTPSSKKHPLLPAHSPPPPPSPRMCKSKKSTSTSSSNPHPKSPSTSSITNPRTSAPTTTSTSFPTTTAATSTSLSSSTTTPFNLRLSLPQDSPTFFPFSEIASATNNFLSKRLSSSSSSSSWRCTLRSRDSVVFQRSYQGNPDNLLSQVSKFCKFHHSSLIKLLGVSFSGDNHIYLVYEYVAGASLVQCLRNPRNPNFTPLSKWIWRMQIATDLADGLSYIHSQCKTVHNRIKSSSVIITEPNYNARICHFGAADLAGEVPETETETDDVSIDSSPKVYRRSNSRTMRIEGTRGYIAPEVITGVKISFKSDIYAFGVVLLELISGREPLKYTVNRQTKDYERVSLIETARELMGMEDEHGEMEEEERRGRVRRWVDQRLRDSYPVDVAERLIHVALRCVEDEAFMRPDMTWVAGKVSMLFLDSQVWEEQVRVPTDFSVSLAPR